MECSFKGIRGSCLTEIYTLGCPLRTGSAAVLDATVVDNDDHWVQTELTLQINYFPVSQNILGYISL